MEAVVLCDTNILIDYFKGDGDTASQLERLGRQRIAISIITASELVYGAINKRELQQLTRRLAAIKILPINREVSFRHLELMKAYSLSHNLTLPDALIAATALHHSMQLFTRNVKDFQYITDLHLYQPVA